MLKAAPPALGWRARLEGLRRRFLRMPPVRGLNDVMRAYDRGDGGMLAGALAYFAFFTVVPALLLFVSLVGVLVEDKGLRDRVVQSLVDRLDPIREVSTAVIDGLAVSGRTGTIIGIVGLLWGASGFYGVLQGAMQRMFPGPSARGILQTRARGVISVVFILGSMVTAVLLIFALPLVGEWLRYRCLGLGGIDPALASLACSVDVGAAGGVLSVAGTTAVSVLACLVVYVVIPPDAPTMREALRPGLVAGAAIGLLTSLFGVVAPLLVREWLALGIVGSVFVSLVWFRLIFQALIYGAASSRLRRDRGRARRGPPSV